MKNPPLSPIHGVWMTPVNGTNVQARLVVDHLLRRNNVHEPSFLIFDILNSRQQYDAHPLCLDLGANQGQSVVSLKNVVPSARVICFEPLPWCITSLNYMQSLAEEKFPPEFKFSIEPYALGDTEGFVDLWMPGSPDYMLTSQASVDEQRSRSNACFRYIQTLFSEPLDEVTVHHVRPELRKLDSFNLVPAAIKIDVEDHELAAVLGGQDTIARYRPLLHIETVAQRDQVISFLKGFGYEPFCFYPDEGRVIPFGIRANASNVIFMTEQHQAIATSRNLA